MFQSESNDLGFQFHKGTIRTVYRCVEVISDSDFNSIKVRLEQLKVFAADASKLEFQFHKGTIRTVGLIRKD